MSVVDKIDDIIKEEKTFKANFGNFHIIFPDKKNFDSFKKAFQKAIDDNKGNAISNNKLGGKNIIKTESVIDMALHENSTDNAHGALEAIIGTLKKSEGKDKDEMLDMANGIMDFYKKEKSFSPKQAEWIANTSKALFK